MKKIIYSLVIMIAAGSLFTSCIENQESTGQRAVQQAKAEYLEALANLRTADAAVQNATAELIKAQAAVQTAIAAQEAAQAQYMQLVNELKEAQNEAAKAELEAKIAEIQAQAEIDAVNAQAELLEAVQALEELENKIEVAAAQMTDAEKEAIQAAYNSYTNAAEKYLEAVEKYNKAVADLYNEAYKSGEVQIEDQQAEIAGYEKEIAETQKSIEALQTSAEAVAAVIEEYAADTVAIKAEIVEAVSAVALWEATNWDEAVKSYNAAWKAYAEAMPDGPEFFFGDLDEDGKDIAKVYAIEGTGNEALWKTLKSIVNWEDTIQMGEKGLEVGPVSSEDIDEMEELVEKLHDYIYGDGDKKAGLEGMVEVLKRDLVVVDNAKEGKEKDALVKKAKELDSTYNAIQALLAKGFDKSDLAAAGLKAQEDSLKKFQGDSTNWVNKLKELKQDTDAQLTAIRKASSEYVDAVEGFITAVNNMTKTNLTKDDTVKFVDAAKKLGVAQAAYLGHQDSLKYYYEFETATGKPKEVKIAFADLDYDGFVETAASESGKVWAIYANGYFRGKTGEGVPADTVYTAGDKTSAINRIFNIVKGNNEYTETIKDNSAGFAGTDFAIPGNLSAIVKSRYDKGASIVYAKEVVISDTLQWYNVTAAMKAATKDLVAKMAADKNAVDSLSTAKTASWQGYAVNAKKVVDKLKLKYYNQRDIFYGGEGNYTEWDETTMASALKALTFHRTRATIEGENGDDFIVYKVGEDGKIYATDDRWNTFKTQWDEQWEDTVGEAETIFYVNGKITLYGQLINAIYEADLAKNYAANTKILEDFEAAVAQIEKDFEAAVIAAGEGSEEYNAALAELLGVDKNGDFLKECENFDKAYTVDGKWYNKAGKVLGGLQEKWANEYAGEYAELVAEADKIEEEGQEMIEYLTDLINTNKAVWEAAYNMDTEEWQEFDKVEEAIKELEGDIKDAEEKIADCEKVIAAIEAGADANALAYELAAEKVEKLALDVEDLAAMVEYYRNLYETLVATYTK